MKSRSGQLQTLIMAQAGSVLKYTFYAIVIVVGAALFFYFDSLGAIDGVFSIAFSSAAYVYQICGIVSVGLIPLSVWVLVLGICQIGHHIGVWSFSPHHIRKYELAENIGPILGILGTMLGLVEALRGLDVDEGLQMAIKGMSIGVGQALWSSVFGLLLALAAYVFRHAYESSKKRQGG